MYIEDEKTVRKHSCFWKVQERLGSVSQSGFDSYVLSDTANLML